MIKSLTSAGQATDSRWSSGWQYFSSVCQAHITRLSRRWSRGWVDTDQAADVMIVRLSKWWSHGWLGAGQEADMRLSSCWQVLINWLTGTDQAAE